MVSDEIEEMLVGIGQLLAKDIDYPIHRTLLFAKLDHNMVGPSIYKDRGTDVLYRRTDGSLMYPLLDLWEAFDPDKRWAEMEYFIHDGRFDVTYVYRDEIDTEEDPMERRDRIVRRYYGDKPIVYPPWDPANPPGFEL